MECQLVRALRLLVISAILGFGAPAFGAEFLFKARETEFWDGTRAVIVARVTEVHRKGESTQYYVATIEPLICVAGLFNPAAHPRLIVDMNISDIRPVKRAPRDGELVLTVVTDRSRFGVPGRRFTVAHGYDFMPDASTLVFLEKLDDPVIIDVLHKMQAARPTTVPTTRPAPEQDRD